MMYDSDPRHIAITLGSVDEGASLIQPLSKCIMVSEKADWAILPSGVSHDQKMSVPDNELD